MKGASETPEFPHLRRPFCRRSLARQCLREVAMRMDRAHASPLRYPGRCVPTTSGKAPSAALTMRWPQFRVSSVPIIPTPLCAVLSKCAAPLIKSYTHRVSLTYLCGPDVAVVTLKPSRSMKLHGISMSTIFPRISLKPAEIFPSLWEKCCCHLCYQNLVTPTAQVLRSR